MSSFPKILQFKQKMLPQAHLQRWSNWFSQWTFNVKYVKGKYNVVADFFSRPPKPKSLTTITTHNLIIPCVYPLDFFLENIHNLPPEIRQFIFEQVIPKRSITSFKRFLEITIFRHGLVFTGLKFHLEYPFP